MDVSEIISELDDHGFEDTDSTRKVATINDIVGDMCSREPWPFLEDDAALAFDAGDSAPTIPTDFRAALVVKVAGQRVLQPERLDTMVKTYSDLTSQGCPAFYYFVGLELRVWPVPDRAYTGTLYYLKTHPELSADSVETDILIPRQHHRAITQGALSRLYAMEDDPELAVMFEKQYEFRLKTMENDTWKRQYDRPDRVVDLWSDLDDLYL